MTDELTSEELIAIEYVIHAYTAGHIDWMQAVARRWDIAIHFWR